MSPLAGAKALLVLSYFVGDVDSAAVDGANNVHQLL